VIPEFMIQGGDPAGTGMGGPGYQFEDETKGSPRKFDKPGKLAMTNAGPTPTGLITDHTIYIPVTSSFPV
jgi:peptidyl-prolyl cis-trans isomerase A (cyclophilin A)